MTSNYRQRTFDIFARNVDSLGDRGKNRFFQSDLKLLSILPQILIVKEKAPKNVFLGKNQFIQSDLKIFDALNDQ